MKVIIDECISKSTRLILKEAKYNLINVEKILGSGTEDKKIFKYAVENKIPIITHDRGFGILYYFSESEKPTIVIIKVLSPHPEATNRLLKNFLSHFDLKQKKNQGKLIIVSENKIRIRSY
ncbi:MAG: hypothetical protein EU549_01130 [Promethearchaeota archaeon]|nr:MAG: hypothetical protein EU549_01130 [Candidatus Lokiarchaeota archaeon]